MIKAFLLFVVIIVGVIAVVEIKIYVMSYNYEFNFERTIFGSLNEEEIVND